MKNFQPFIDQFFSNNRGIVSQSNNNLNNKLCDIFPFKSIKYYSGDTIDTWKVPLGWELIRADIKVGSKKYTNIDIPLLVPFGTESFSCFGKYKEIKEYIITIPNMPTATPYRTNYYSPYNHKVCIPFNLLSEVSDETEISINVETSFSNSYLEILEIHIKGKVEDEILFTTYNCHPGLGNDNFSGIIGICNIYEMILKLDKPHYSYRFAIFPETIGAICYVENLSNREIINKVLFSTVLTCLGGNEKNYTFKDTPIKSVYANWYKKELQKLIPDLKIYPYSPDGSDERQFSSPNVSIPSASLCRNRYYDYEEYHTSLDTLEYMNKNAVGETCQYIFKAVRNIDKNLRIPKSSAKFGEPCLSSYELDFHSGGEYNSNSNNSLVINKKITSYLISTANGKRSKEELIAFVSEILKVAKKEVSLVFEKLIELGIIVY